MAVQERILQAFVRTHPGARFWGRRRGPGNREHGLWVARDGGGTTEVEFYGDGWTRVISTWGSSIYYDKWEVDPRGEVRYLGPCEEPRFPPSWLADVPGLIWPRREWVERA